MKLVERKVDITQLALSDEQSAIRSKGLHISSVISYLSEKIGRRDNGMTREQLDQYAIFGRIWEQYLADRTFTRPRYERIGEIEKDGIIGSPDAVDTHEWAVQEYKCWWRSSNKPIEDSREAFWQIQAYCYMLGMTRASLHVAFVCGNWRPPIPETRAWDITFTVPELKANWEMIMQAAREMPSS